MGFIFSVIKKVLKLLLYFAAFVTIIVLIPNLPPYNSKFTSIKIDPLPERVGPLAPNGVLNNVEKLYSKKLLGPEAYYEHNGEIYTSLATGEIVKLSPGGHVTFVTKIGQPCTGLTQDYICGRPLGFSIDGNKNLLYVADAYYGIWKVDLKTDKKQLLVSPRVEIEGRKPMLFNSIKLTKNGDFYWTDSTTDFHLSNGALSVLTDPSGRLFHYNAATNQSKVILDDLWFANGLALSPDNTFILVTETGRFRIMKHYISGPKKGQTEVFANLPGTPDNLQTLPSGEGVLVALYTVFGEDEPALTRALAELPPLRKFLVRMHMLAELPFIYLNQFYPHHIFEQIVYNIGHFKTISGILPKVSGLVQLDWEGKYVAAYYNDDGTMPSLSDAIVVKDKLYLGTPHVADYVAAVPVPPQLKKAFATTKTKSEPAQPKPAPKQKVEEKKEAPKVTKPVVQEPPKKVEKQPEPKPVPKQPEPKATPPKQQAKPAAPKQEAKPTPAPTKQPEAKPKPAETKPVAKQPEVKPKPAEPKPAPKQPEAKPTTSKPPVAKPAQLKAEPKQAESKQAKQPAANAVPKQEANKPAPKQETKPKPTEKPKDKPEQIPIKEEIPSDTIKPTKETLKVIKKGGPVEIPNPNL